MSRNEPTPFRRLASAVLIFQNAFEARCQLDNVLDRASTEAFVHFTCMLSLSACDYDWDLQSESSSSSSSSSSSDSSGSDFGALLANPADIAVEPQDNEQYPDAEGDSHMTDATMQPFGTLVDLSDPSESFSPVDDSDLQDHRSDASTLRVLENFASIHIHQTVNTRTLDVPREKSTIIQHNQNNVAQSFSTSKEDSTDEAHAEHVEYAKGEEVGTFEHVEYANSGVAENDEGGSGYDGDDNDPESQPGDPMEELRQDLKDQCIEMEYHYQKTRRQPPLDYEITAQYIYWWYLHACNTLRCYRSLQHKGEMALLRESDRGERASDRWKRAVSNSREEHRIAIAESDRVRAARESGAQLLQDARATLVSQGRNVDCADEVRKKGLFRGVSVVNRPVERSRPGSSRKPSKRRLRHALEEILTMEEFEKMENPENVFKARKRPIW